MLTEKDYCDYETCVALEELGFPLHPYGNREIDTALRLTRLLYEAQKWLREEKGIEVVVLGEKEIGGPYYADIYTESGYAGYIHKPCEKYEEALLEGVRASIKILQDEQKENN